jgi:AcrR family transcriptional regulator
VFETLALAIHFSYTQIEMSRGSSGRVPTNKPKKRTYRMTARADAAAATRERLLAAAWEHFGSRPYEEVRLQDVAGDAGVTVQTLYLRFGNKDDLLTAAYRWWGTQEMAARNVAQGEDVAEAVTIVFAHYEAHGPAILRMLSQEERVPAVRHLMDLGRDYHREWAERTFEPLLHGLRGRTKERRLIGIIAATDVLVWKLLRVDMGVERGEAEKVVADMVRASSADTSSKSHRPPTQ